MSYPELPGRAMPYHVDGTVVKAVRPDVGVVHAFSDAETAELNDYDYTGVFYSTAYPNGDVWLVFAFPEKRHLRAVRALVDTDGSLNAVPIAVEGSNDTTNGVDGTWTAADPDDTWGSNLNEAPSFDWWRYPATGRFPNDDAYKVWRLRFGIGGSSKRYRQFLIAHLYGHKASDETPDDILFVDSNTGDELTTPLNFHAVPAGSSKYLNFRLKNVSPDKTANNVDISVDDPDDIIRVSWNANGPWDVSLHIDTLNAGASSDIIYVKAEGPAPPTPLKPHRAPIVVTVGAWT